MAILSAGLCLSPARAQDLDVSCPNAPHQYVDLSGGRCPPMPTSIVMGQKPVTVITATCTYTTYMYPIGVGEYVTASRADLYDAIECIPFFWGQWWQEYGPTGDYFGDANTATANGDVITATANFSNPAINNSQACAQEGFLSSGLTATTVIGYMSCPCLVDSGENCPGTTGTVLGGFLVAPSGPANGQAFEWGTTWGGGYIYPTAWQTITYYGDITYITYKGKGSPFPPGPDPTPPGPGPGPGPGPTPPGPGPGPGPGPAPPGPGPGPGPGPTPPGPGPSPFNPTNSPGNTPTNTTANCPMGQFVIPLNVMQWLNLNYDSSLQMQQIQSVPPLFQPLLTWSSQNSSLYQGLSSGYATWITDSSGYPWLVFGANETNNVSTTSDNPAQQIPDEASLMAIGMANGTGEITNLQEILEYGIDHYAIDVPPVFVNGCTLVPLPAGNNCLTIDYQLPYPTFWSLDLAGSTACLENSSDANQITTTIIWNTTGLTNLLFSSTDVNLEALLPTNPAPSGSMVITADLNLAALGLTNVEITLFGTDTNGLVHTDSQELTPEWGNVIVTDVSSTLSFTNPGQVTVTWNAEVDTDVAQTGVWILVYQGSNSTPMFQQSIVPPAAGTNITVSVTSPNGAALSLVLSACNSYTNTVAVPQITPPIITEWAMFPNPANLTLLQPNQSGNIVNPGTVIYQITNPASAMVAYALSNTETRNVISGTFSNDVFFYTNNQRSVVMTASTIQGGMFNPVIAAPLSQIYLETPLMNLPAVLYNNLTVNVTNIVQSVNGMTGEVIELEALLLPFANLVNFTSYAYPQTTGVNYFTQENEVIGVVTITLDGNNTNTAGAGFWTNELQNLSLADNWYPYLSDALPSPVPLLPSGISYPGTLFDVAPISVQITGTELMASTVTSNAIMAVVQQIDGVPVTNASTITATTIANTAGTTVDFANVDLGYPTTLIAMRQYYNAAQTNLPITVIFELTNQCQAAITINHAITNLFVESENSDGSFTYTTNEIPSFTTATVTIPLDESNGTYIVFAQPITTGIPLNIGLTLTNSYTFNLTAQGGTLTSEDGDGQPWYTMPPPRFLLVITNTSVPVMITVNGNPNIWLTAEAPWANWTPTSLQISTNSLSLSVGATYATTNWITTPCSTNALPIDVIINQYTAPPFDIPVSTPSTNTCTNFENGSTISQ